MPIPSEYAVVVNGLIASTESGKLKWKELSPQKNKFRAKTSKGFIEIGFGSGAYGSNYFYLEIQDQRGERVHGFLIDDADGDFERLSRFYDRVLRIARGVDNILSELADELGS